MPVYLPTAATGNGTALVTLGPSAEIMSFFYPRIDFADNVREGLAGVYFGSPPDGRFSWLFDPEWQRAQRYVPETNIVETILTHEAQGLELTFRDFVLPDVDSLVRLVQARNLGRPLVTGQLIHTFELWLGEVASRQAVRYFPEVPCVAQYFRGIALAIGGTPFGQWGCGNAGGPPERSAKETVYRGSLSGTSEVIGRVDFALSHNLELPPGESIELRLILAGAMRMNGALDCVRSLAAWPADELLQAATEHDRLVAETVPAEAVLERYLEPCRRSALALHCLRDAETGALIAAPEFDPGYERSGGYGYVWPRDACEAAICWAEVSGGRSLRDIADWLLRTLDDEDHWDQRYWLTGDIAPAWCLDAGRHQLDQSASAVRAISRCALSLPPGRRRQWLEERWERLTKATAALAATIGPYGLHEQACDLWESSHGTFVYTNAAIHAALAAASRCAEVVGSPKAEEWWTLAQRTREACLRLHDGQRFARGVTADGSIDWTADSSVLGVVEPFALLDLDRPEEAALAASTVAFIEERLGVKTADGVGIKRFEGEAYLGGAVACVNTLWLATVLLRLADSAVSRDRPQARQYLARAQSYVDYCLRHATSTGLLPELFGTTPDTAHWAAPHAWASGLLLKAAAMAQRVQTALGHPR